MSTIPQVGDLVRVGKGKVLWEVTGLGEYASGDRYAVLADVSVGGYTSFSCTFDRLTIVSQEPFAEKVARQGDA